MAMLARLTGTEKLVIDSESSETTVCVSNDLKRKYQTFEIYDRAMRKPKLSYRAQRRPTR